jgi:hypothetical protein
MAEAERIDLALDQFAPARSVTSCFSGILTEATAMLQRITIQLGRTPDRPGGDARDGYEIIAPLTADGRLDAARWRQERDRCRVRRFRPGSRDRYGWLLHRAGGAGGARWAIDYDDQTPDDDEAFFRIDRHRIAVGEYIAVGDGGDDMAPFKIVSIKPLLERPAAAQATG